MNRQQYILTAGAVILFLLLYFVFDKVPPAQKIIEKSRVLNVEATGLQNLLNEAKTKLDKEQNSVIEAIRLDLNALTEDSSKVTKLKLLAGTWYNYGFPQISGVYAENIAEILKTEESWSIAGTTFALCVKNAEEEKLKNFCSKRAIKSFENAVSLDPEKMEPKINLALSYVENPTPDDPMQGILMLRDLNEKYPDNVMVLNQLARLALQTNQIDRALERVERVLVLQPDNQTAICLAAELYRIAGQENKARIFEEKCIH